MALTSLLADRKLGLKPLQLGQDSYQADATFDPTVKIPVSAPVMKAASVQRAAPAPTSGTTAYSVGDRTTTPVPTQPPVVSGPTTQQTTPTGTTPPSYGPTLPTTWDPSQLTWEGQTYTGAPVVSTQTGYTQNFDIKQVSDLVDELERFTGIRLDEDWRKKAAADPEKFLQSVQAEIFDTDKWKVRAGNLDTKMRNRLNDWLSRLKGSMQATGPVTNEEAKINYLGQSAYNQALERLKYAGAEGSRADEEQAMAALAARGLLNSGIASRELANLRNMRSRSFYDASAALNELLMKGEMGRLTERDIAKLQADLQKRNQEALANIQGEWGLKQAEASQPDPWAQIVGTGIGSLPMLLSAPAPQRPTQESWTGGQSSRVTNPYDWWLEQEKKGYSQ